MKLCSIVTHISKVVNIHYDQYMSIPATLTSPACCPPSPAAAAVAIGATEAEELSARLRALADPTRLRLLAIVAASEGGEACVCDLTEPVGLSQPTVSHHLKVLTRAGFLTRTKRGTWAYYAVDPRALSHVSQLLTTLGTMP